MNQILMVEDKKKKKNKSSSGTADIKNILMFFVVALIVFGIFFIGQGSYAIYKDSKGKNTDNLPIVTITRVNDKAIVTVNSVNEIVHFKYSLNSSEETSIEENSTFVEEEIVLPMENSILNISIEENIGRIVKYAKQFNLEGIDITEPNIEIAEEANGSIRITAIDETAISYITYKLNDEGEVRIDKSELENDKIINYILSLPRGENQLIINAVDVAGNIETLQKKIIVSGQTTVDFNIENGKLVIKAEDPDGIKNMEINLNGVVYVAKDLNQKLVIIPPLDIVEGVNTVSVTITNVNSLETRETKEFNYAQ